MLELTGWNVQGVKDLDFRASRGVALREFPLKSGFADYMLFVDRQAVGIVEAKKEGTTLGGVDTNRRSTSMGFHLIFRGSEDRSPSHTRARASRQYFAT
jgi:type I restriction enzyme R subunit